MEQPITMPQRRLSKHAINVWIIKDIIMEIIAFSVLGLLFYLDYIFSWKEWIGWILIGITVLSVLSAVWSLFFEPYLTYKHWRYDLNDEFLQLKSGALKEVHHIVPMTKIQSIATIQGPLLRKYGLLSLSIKTMGSTHELPGLSEETAADVRSSIARYAKIKEVEE
ncbi:PH domain-containing protein [Salibacterium aidingense]|uniref:PH domain-containing protein n=1 Tax=Salibacterium aidingense TaxID=384933 RepID=UPI003BD83363